MKKYKLIKPYPSLPKNWEKGMEVGQGDRNDGTYSPCNSKYETTSSVVLLSKEEVENNSEFWDEVIEYPIGTKAENTRINSVITKHSDGWYKIQKTAYTDKDVKNSKYIKLLENKVVEKDYEILTVTAKENHPNIPVGQVVKKWLNINMDYFNIHSVKRLSDGEVFTVDDKINGTASINEKIKFGPGYVKITSFFINDEKLGFKITTGICYPEYNTFSVIRHYKAPLFTTDDGVAIFEGDEVFVVHNSFRIEKFRKINPELNYFKRFSTKKAAKEYVLYSMPKISINDIYALQTVSDPKLIDSLKTIVKNRL